MSRTRYFSWQISPSCLTLAEVVLSAAVFGGCGSGEIAIPGPAKSPLFPVRGAIALPDGKPLSEGMIRLIPVKQPGWTASGKIQPSGQFTMQTADQGDGVPEGEYRVSIDSSLLAPASKGTKARLAVPVAYSDPEGSDLRVTVKSSPNDLGTIKLLPDGPPRSGAGRHASSRD